MSRYIVCGNAQSGKSTFISHLNNLKQFQICCFEFVEIHDVSELADYKAALYTGDLWNTTKESHAEQRAYEIEDEEFYNSIKGNLNKKKLIAERWRRLERENRAPPFVINAVICVVSRPFEYYKWRAAAERMGQMLFMVIYNRRSIVDPYGLELTRKSPVEMAGMMCYIKISCFCTKSCNDTYEYLCLYAPVYLRPDTFEKPACNYSLWRYKKITMLKNRKVSVYKLNDENNRFTLDKIDDYVFLSYRKVRKERYFLKF
jgi:hypothetical protein